MFISTRQTTNYLVYFSRMSQKVAIFETTHFEGSYPVIRLFDYQDNLLTIFTNAYCYRQFSFLLGSEISRYQWVLQEANEPLRKFIDRASEKVRSDQTDLFYINTVDNNHLFFASALATLKTTRTILTLHDINTHFYFKYRWNLRRLVRITGKKRLIRVVKEFNVVAQTMVPYLSGISGNRKPVHCVPGAFFDPSRYVPPPSSLSPFEVVIPGSIDARRRNYEVVLELAQACKLLQWPVHFTLLGGAQDEYGRSILEKCGSYNNIKTYIGEVVDQPEFDRVMNASHLVFVPSVLHTVISDVIEETYGLTKSSGNMFDIIKHARPFLAPSGLQLDPVLESSCIRYSSLEQITAQLRKLIANGGYDQWQRQAYENSMSYTLEAIRSRNPALFLR